MSGSSRFVVVASRQWHQFDVRVSVDDHGISVSMLLPYFLRALAKEIGVADSMALEAAAAKVVADMQAETSRVM